MRLDLLRSMAEVKDATNAVVLTHNIDFVFLQTVVMSVLRRCGHPTLTVFADAGCAAESFANQYPVLSGLGVRYRVVPVAMEHGFRFHPKAVLLSGPEEAHLFVGSGNLTFGGWRENGEVWVHMNVEDDGTAPFAAFRDFLWEVLDRVPLRDAVEAQVAEAFDPHTRQWASEMAEPAVLVGRAGRGAPLLGRLMDLVGPGKINELTICAPFFDDRGEALREMLSRAEATKARVLVQPERTTLIRKAWQPSSSRAELVRVAFQHEDEDENVREAFVHAKWFAFRRGAEVMVFAGSANVSRAALLASEDRGNAELLALQRMDAGEFREAYLGELAVLKDEIELPKSQPPVDPRDGAALRVLAARYESGALRVAYRPVDAKVRELRADDEPLRFETCAPGEIRAATAGEPATVVIVARVEGGALAEARGWVDHEQALRATARGRSLSHTLHGRVRPDEWGVGAWAEILDVFGRHLRYLPSRSRKPGPDQVDRRGSSELPEYTSADIFTKDYRLPPLPPLGATEAGPHDGRIRSLQQLLLRWFGVPIPDAEDAPEDQTNEAASLESEGIEGDEPVDGAQPPPDDPGPMPPPQPPQQDARRALKALEMVVSAMENPDFLRDRPPELLSADIRLASVLLRVGLKEGWIDGEVFFDATHRIWSAWFFTSEEKHAMGALELRLREADDKASFIKAMRCPELTASLLAWAFAVPLEGDAPDIVRFSLARALSVARLPWLWDCDPKAVAEELAHVLAYSSPAGDQAAASRDALAQWTQVLQDGHALRRLEAVLRGRDLPHFLGMVPPGYLKCGEVLWQGPAGFCVVLNPVERVGTNTVMLLKLQGSHQPSKFQAKLTLPVRALLNSEAFLDTDALAAEVRQVLARFFKKITTTWQRNQDQG